MDKKKKEGPFDFDGFVQLIQRGFEYETKYNNYEEANELFCHAKNLLSQYYGNDNKLCDFIHLYDYLKELHQGLYKDSIIKLSRAGNFFDQFEQKDIVDDFTQWIYDNKEELLKEAINNTWYVYQFLDVDMSIERWAAPVLLNIGNPIAALNEVMVDSAGLPREFQYFIKDIANNSGSVKKDDLADIMEGIKYLRQLENRNIECMEQEEKVSAAKKILEYMERVAGFPVANGGLSRMMDSVLIRTYYTAAQGFINLDEPEEAGNFLRKLIGRMDDLEYSLDQTKIRLMECLYNHRLNNHGKAISILNEVLECENDMVLQVFSIHSDLKQLSYLGCLDSLLKLTLYACVKVLGDKAAYTQLLRLRTLTIDYGSINLGGVEGMEIAHKRMRLETDRQAGKNIQPQLDEMQDWFNKKSQGIFECQALDVCAKLSDRRALLEFTRIEDESGKESYLVFLLLSDKVLSLSLGSCQEMDCYLDDIYNYMRIYSQQRYNPVEIRYLDSYRCLYEKVLVPIGEMLPVSVHSLYIVPEGGFARIPFELLPCFGWYDKYLGDEYEISYLNTGRELIYTGERKAGTESIVIGAPDFALNTQYPELPASLYEVQVISEILGVTPYTGSRAVPGCIKGSPRILHISTHSYYENVTEDERIDPMKRTGFVLAGGERLSARDISLFDLHGTELAALAICGEGRDTVIYNDVELGIRRAFINAGVKHLIINLWKTDDRASALFMECFYDYYIVERMDIKKALKLARQYLKERTASQIRIGPYYHKELEALLSLFKDNEKPYSHPYYWAGFVLIGR